MSDVLPPEKVFLHPRQPLGDTRKWETLYGFQEFSFPPQGFLAHYQGRPPNKGMIYSQAAEANNVMKRVGIGLVMMLKPKRKWASNFLFQFTRLANYLYTPHYLHARYYNDCSRELFELVYRLLRKLGFSFALSYDTGRIVATYLEYENGYRYRVEDLFSATSKQQLLANPRKELKRLEQIYLARETYTGEDAVADKFRMVFRLVRLLLLIPKVKKAFRFALVDSEFKNFQLDNIERYWANRHSEYHFGGEPYGIRQLKQGYKLYGF